MPGVFLQRKEDKKMTQEQKEIIFMRTLESEHRLLRVVINYGNHDYRRFIEKEVAVYYALYQIIKDLDLEIEYSDWRLNGEE